ncbi:MAG: hypothetical protein HC844_17365 [Tabrizicola sp.]|nr:hypothetical protein [Tabrizicola sp.]
MTVALIIAGLPALAETPMTGDQFEAHVGTNRLTYDYGGGLLGIEEYLPDRRVRWAFEADTCLEGTWYEDGDQICFTYENGGEPACWLFFDLGGTIKGRFMGEGGGWEIFEIEKKDAPLSCSGPDVGV